MPKKASELFTKRVVMVGQEMYIEDQGQRVHPSTQQSLLQSMDPSPFPPQNQLDINSTNSVGLDLDCASGGFLEIGLKGYGVKQTRPRPVRSLQDIGRGGCIG